MAFMRICILWRLGGSYVRLLHISEGGREFITV